MSTIPGFCTTAEAAAVIGVDPSQVRRYCIGGKLPGRKVGKAWLIPTEKVKTFSRPPIGNPLFLQRR